MLPGNRIRSLCLRDMNESTPIGGDCENHWGFVHSMGAYDANNFVGARNYEGNPKTLSYHDFYDAIRDLDKEPCGAMR